jgi:hypothetical protein
LIERTAKNTEDFLRLRADLLKKRAKNRSDLEQLAKVTEGAANLVASLADWFRPMGQEKTDVLDTLVGKLRKLLR